MDYHPCMEISQGYRGYSNNIKRKQEKKLQTDQSLDIHKTFKDSKSEKKDSNLFFPGFLEYIIKFLDFASIEQLFFVDRSFNNITLNALNILNPSIKKKSMIT